MGIKSVKSNASCPQHVALVCFLLFELSQITCCLGTPSSHRDWIGVHRISAVCAALGLQIVMRYKCCRFECPHRLCQSDKPRVLAQCVWNCVFIFKQPKQRVHFISVLYSDKLHLRIFVQRKALVSRKLKCLFPCLPDTKIHSYNESHEMHYFSDLFYKVHYMFRTGPLSIIRSISTLYTRNRYLSNNYCVYTVLRYSWWWTVDMSKTCTVIYQINLRNSASRWLSL